jgi:hypothetical protein
MPREIAISVIAMAFVIRVSVPAYAQVLDPPSRSTPGVLGGGRSETPTSQNLTASFQLLGSYDDPIARGLGPDGRAIRGTTTTAAALVRYRVGGPRRMVEASGRLFVNSFSAIDISPLIGGDVDVRAVTGLGRRNRLTMNGGQHYQPRFLLDSVGSPRASNSSGPVSYGATTGATDEMWLSRTAAITLERDWTTRQRTLIQAGAFHLQPSGGDRFSSRDISAIIRQEWNISRAARLNVSYRHAEQRTGGLTATGDAPVRSHTADLGLTLQKRWSATRRIEVSGGGGLIRARSFVHQTPMAFITPSVFGSVRLDLLRSWAVAADMRREVSVLHGLTPQPFITEAGSLHVGGRLGPRVDVAATVGLSRGAAPAREIGSFDASSIGGQLRVSVTRWIALLTSYSYYSHFTSDLPSIPNDYPATFERSSVRVGMTFLLPLYGTFPTN